MHQTAAEPRPVIFEREIPYAPEKVWRALTEPHLIEEWLMKNDFELVADHKFNLRGDWGVVDCQVLKVQPDEVAVLQLGGPWAGERRHLDADSDEQGHHLAHGAVGLPAGSGAILPGRQGRMGQLLRQAGGSAGAGGLRSLVASQQAD